MLKMTVWFYRKYHMIRRKTTLSHVCLFYMLVIYMHWDKNTVQESPNGFTSSSECKRLTGRTEIWSETDWELSKEQCFEIIVKSLNQFERVSDFLYVYAMQICLKKNSWCRLEVPEITNLLALYHRPLKQYRVQTKRRRMKCLRTVVYWQIYNGLSFGCVKLTTQDITNCFQTANKQRFFFI